MKKNNLKFFTVLLIVCILTCFYCVSLQAQDGEKGTAINQAPAGVSEAQLNSLEKEAQKAHKKAELAQEQLEAVRAKIASTALDSKVEEGRNDILGSIAMSLVVLLIGLLLLLLLKIGITQFERVLTKKDVIRESESTLQIKTVVKLFRWVGTIVILLTVFYIIAENHGLNLAPLIAGAGIAGLAFGFGGQYLIRDLINGLFILIEGQYRINDVVKIGQYGGLVEDINLRITTLRDLEGRVIVIPNGEVKEVVNFTKGYAQALLDIGVAYKENVDYVMAVIKEIGKGMREDKHFGTLMLGDVEMLGVDDFADSQVTIKFRVKTLPIKQWDVMREFRRRIKNRFDELGIEIPFPHSTIYWGTGKDNQWVKVLAEQIALGKKE
jgi:moderate conductance mechanosensitive channel